MPRRTDPLSTAAATLALLLVTSCGGKSDAAGPQSAIEGGIYVATSADAGGLPVLINRVTTSFGDTYSDYLVADTIIFPFLSGRVMETAVLRQDVNEIGRPPSTTTGSTITSGAWTQSGSRIILTYERSPLSATGSTVDTVELVNGALRRHLNRDQCEGCAPKTRLELVYTRAFQP